MRLYQVVCQAAPIALAVAGTLCASTAFTENKDDDEHGREASAIASAAVSLSDAIATARTKANGTPVKAGLEEEDDQLVYEIKLAGKEGKVSRVFLDPSSGKIMKTSEEGLIRRTVKAVFDRDDEQELAAVTNSKVDLARAVALAEHLSGGRAFGADVENENGKVLYEIKLAKNGNRETVYIDPQSGEVMQRADEEKSEENERGDHEGERGTREEEHEPKESSDASH